MAPATPVCAVDLYWLPLGAGGHVVRLNGKAYEALMARVEHRRPLDLYHSALQVYVPRGRYTIESTPVPAGDPGERGAVCGGAVGSRRAGRLRIFRYEVRCWRDGVIPDLHYAVGGPQRLTEDAQTAGRLLDLVPQLPTPVWGRDELRTGDMWNSNSIISWLLVSSGLDAEAVKLPSGGRAPGWDAGLVVARSRRPAIGLLTPTPADLARLLAGDARIGPFKVAEGALPPEFILQAALDVAHDEAKLRWVAPDLFVSGGEGLVVGSGGFKGAPEGGAVEVGYGVAPSARGQGVATQAVRLLVRRAL